MIVEGKHGKEGFVRLHCVVQSHRDRKFIDQCVKNDMTTTFFLSYNNHGPKMNGKRHRITYGPGINCLEGSNSTDCEQAVEVFGTFRSTKKRSKRDSKMP